MGNSPQSGPVSSPSAASPYDQEHELKCLFNEWVYERDQFSTRLERFLEDMECGDTDPALWLVAAFKAGYAARSASEDTQRGNEPHKENTND